MNNNYINFFFILCCFTFFGFNVTAQSNFVIVVLDDQGWTGTSVQMDASLLDSKSDYYITSELESLASKGMTFSRGYAPAPKCSPSRNSILIGKTPARANFTNTDNVIATGKILIEPTIITVLDGNEVTYAEWLKSIGMNYRTAHFGKWHQGNTSDSSPANNGFDFTDGSTSNGDGSQGGTVQADPKKIFELTTKSIEFIQNAVNDGVPFALQLSHYAVHSDIEARQETIDLYNDEAQRPIGTRHDNVEYAAMTEDTDDGLGLLLDEITNLGLDSNTYVIFVSDNGGQMNFTDNSPLSFGKTFIKEGGIRVPFIVKGPNIIQDSRNSEVIVGYDLFPTIAELTGSTTALPENLDGQSIVPLLTGSSFSRTNPIYFHSPHYDNNPNKKPRSALVSGNYKLMVEYETGEILLHDLSSDIGENIDLLGSQSTLARTLTIKLRDYLKEVNASMPKLDPTHSSFSGSGSDVDGDGLDDEWELKELLSYASDANDDPDNDSFTNLEELINGTDPYVNEDALNMESLFNETSIKIYPNPAEKYFKIDISKNLDVSKISNVKIYNSTARLIYKNNTFEENLNIKNLSSGVYFIKIILGDQQVVKNIIIK
ncbi:sulfatase-like hydrolase/transferase [uncultured Polaribacter sp.]|uniref:sulfatase-like hydrolase/transferase n=1 Tax=uncultured Polaribacter sp. TaxID=174711 RepID=UPI0026263AA4|nr:sulfatase-like hydrolase/transferase [uncultured Polaribacter sp.]